MPDLGGVSWGDASTWLTHLFGGSTAADTATTQALQGLGTGQYGPETASQYTAAGGPTPSATGGGQQVGGDLQNALKGINQAAGSQQNQQQQMQRMQLQNAQSGTGGGRGGENLSTLLQLLNARTNMYMGATNPQSAQPQAQTQKQVGLLGF